jgi:hypothetical protein
VLQAALQLSCFSCWAGPYCVVLLCGAASVWCCCVVLGPMGGALGTLLAAANSLLSSCTTTIQGLQPAGLFDSTGIALGIDGPARLVQQLGAEGLRSRHPADAEGSGDESNFSPAGFTILLRTETP